MGDVELTGRVMERWSDFDGEIDELNRRCASAATQERGNNQKQPLKFSTGLKVLWIACIISSCVTCVINEEVP